MLYCQQALDPQTRPPQGRSPAPGCSAQLVLLPCSSKMEAYQLLKLIEAGADAVELVACPPGTCRFLVGNDRAARRMAYAQGLLERAGMTGPRLGLSRGSDLTTQELLERAGQRAEQVKGLGPNPMKGDRRP